MQVDAGQTALGWYERRGALAIWTKAYTVEQQLGIELAWSARSEHFAHGRLISFEQRSDDAEIWRKVDDCADMQIAVSPAVEAMTDARGERVVRGAMT